MAILAQNKLSLASHKPHFHKSDVTNFRPTRVIHCAAAATGPDPTRIAAARGPRTPDPSLLSTWPHRMWVTVGCAAVLVPLAEAVAGAAESGDWAWPAAAAAAGYVAADLGSGVYHWGIDNYGDASTPVFGSQIEAFQGHHRRPWTITRRQFANNLHALARAVAAAAVPVDALLGGAHSPAAAHAFVGAMGACVMFSQQFHAWAHFPRSRLPPVVAALQDGGVLVSRVPHGAHHREPYNNNYCIVSGVWNQTLDRTKFFEALEMVLFFNLGLRPRSWTQPGSEWTQEEQEQGDDDDDVTIVLDH